MRKLVRPLALVAAMSLLLARDARAEPTAADRATARSLAEEGEDALEKKNYAVAADRFARADALIHAPTLLLELARAQVGLHKFVEAQENYQTVLREGVPAGAPPAFARALREAEKEIAAIPPKLGWVVINVEGPMSPVLSIDDTPVPSATLGVRRAVNPGSHTVKASAEGFLPNETAFAVREGDSAAVSLTLERAPVAPQVASTGGAPSVGPTAGSESAGGSGAADSGPAKRSPQKTYAFVALGVGAAGIAVGAVTGAIAVGKHGQLADACGAGGAQCKPSDQSTLDSYRAMGTVSTIGFVVGGVGGAAGALLLLTLPKKRDKAGIEPLVGLTSVGAKVTF